MRSRAYSSSPSSDLRRLREPAHIRPDPPVISIRAIAPSGTTFSTPVKAVPPGVTVVGRTVVPCGGVVELSGGVTLVPLTLVVPGVVVSVSVVSVSEVVVPEVVVSVVEVSVVVVSVVVVSVVVGVVVVPGVVVSVVVVVAPRHCASSRCAIASALPLNSTNAFVLSVISPLLFAVQWFPCLFMVMVSLPTWSVALVTLSEPRKFHRPPFGQSFVNPCPVQAIVAAKAVVGKTAQASIRTVAAETVMRPAMVSLRPSFTLRSVGMSYLPFLSRAIWGKGPSDGDRMAPPGLHHRAKVHYFD